MGRAAGVIAVIGALCAGSAHPVLGRELRWYRRWPMSNLVPAKPVFTTREPLTFNLRLHSPERALTFCLEDPRGWEVHFFERPSGLRPFDSDRPGRWTVRCRVPPLEPKLTKLALPRRGKHTVVLVLRPRDYEYVDRRGAKPAAEVLPVGQWRATVGLHVVMGEDPAGAKKKINDHHGAKWANRFLQFTVITERFAKGRPARGGEKDDCDLRLAMPVEEPHTIAVDGWHEASVDTEVELHSADHAWLLLRGATLNMHDRMWIDRVELKDNAVAVRSVEARWNGKYGRNTRYRPCFALHVGKLPGGRHEVTWEIAGATIAKAEFDELDRPEQHTLLKTEPKTVKLGFKVAWHPLELRMAKNRPGDWPTSEVTLEKAAADATAVVRATLTGAPKPLFRQPGARRGWFVRGTEDKPGGHVSMYRCRQEAKLVEALSGDLKPGPLTVEYWYVRRASAPGWPAKQTLLPAGTAVILLMKTKTEAGKVLPDTEWNRLEVKRLLGKPHQPDRRDK